MCFKRRLNGKVFTTVVKKRSICLFAEFKDELNECLGSNKKCAEVLHVRSPFSFWVRLDDFKNDFKAMLAHLQRDYATDSKDTIEE